MSRLRLYYVARVFLRAFGLRGDGAAVRLYRKGSNPADRIRPALEINARVRRLSGPARGLVGRKFYGDRIVD
jgi:hypothetical protein